LLCEARRYRGEVGGEVKSERRERFCVKVWCSADEKRLIEQMAVETGLSASSYLRRLGLGYAPRRKVDLDQVQQLMKVNGDLGRLGGLLKLWLTDDPKLDEFKGEPIRRIVRGVLTKIEGTQDTMREIATSILHART
jgi:hypothetical protein